MKMRNKSKYIIINGDKHPVQEINGILKLYGQKYLSLFKDSNSLEKYDKVPINSCNGRKTTEIEIPNNLKHLTQIEIKYTNLTSVNSIVGLNKLKKLEDLVLGNNRISTMKGIEQLTGLIGLDFGKTKMIGLDEYAASQNVELQNNTISKIEGLENLTRLTTLGLDGNRIVEMTGFENLKKLEGLNLSENKIKEIQGLENLKNLKALVLDNNKIKEIKGLDNLTNLERLYLSHNQITEIKGLENLTKLETLYLSHNQIEEIKNLESFSLSELYLDHNRIQKIENLETHGDLWRADFSSNQIESLDNLRAYPELLKQWARFWDCFILEDNPVQEWAEKEYGKITVFGDPGYIFRDLLRRVVP
ncbi:MAG: leucine-rich repeat protein [Candidatus Lokiarchaeota archaeon]|nr:leucine-rich repeat protein [Candidatus Lokiarchaeota archaeon]